MVLMMVPCFIVSTTILRSIDGWIDCYLPFFFWLFQCCLFVIMVSLYESCGMHRVCVFVCVCVSTREREGERDLVKGLDSLFSGHKTKDDGLCLIFEQ